METLRAGQSPDLIPHCLSQRLVDPQAFLAPLRRLAAPLVTAEEAQGPAGG